MRQISALRLIGVGIITAMLLLFQNCGPAKVSSDTLSSNADSNTDLGSSGPVANPTPRATPNTKAALSIFQSNIDFGSVSIFSSASQGILITNTGSVPLTLSKSMVSSVFRFVNTADSATCGSTLAVSESCIIALLFTPESQGSVTGMITITTNAPNSPHLIQLTGRGTF